MSGRRLIVNADDFGREQRINAGIIRAHERGIVTSASLMVRPAGAKNAAAYARSRPALAIGLHVDLGEWEYEDARWRTVYEVVATDDAVAVELETRSQLAAFRRLMGRNPTHLDSHQHVHRDAELVGAAAVRLAHELGVPLRHNDPRIRYCGAFYGQTGDGEPLYDRVSAGHLVELIEELPAGITELACHPGEGAEGAYDRERRLELEALCDPRVRRAIERSGVELLSFADV